MPSISEGAQPTSTEADPRCGIAQATEVIMSDRKKSSSLRATACIVRLVVLRLVALRLVVLRPVVLRVCDSSTRRCDPCCDSSRCDGRLSMVVARPPTEVRMDEK